MPNYVGPALGRLSETLYRGLSDIGKSRLASEELSLKRGKMEQEQRRYEEGAPIREFQRKQATVGLEKEQKLDEAFSVPAFAREASQADQAQGEMGGGFPKAYERLRWISTAVPKIAKALNAKYDSATGTLINMDTGKPLTNRDFQDPITQQKLSGIVGILTDSDKYLQMESDIPEAKALIEQRAKNPVKYYLDELKVKTDYLNQLGTFGIPKGSLTELAGEIKNLKGKIEKYEMTPEEKAKYDKQMLLLDKQIEASKATTARAQRPGKTEFSYVDKQIIKRELDDMDSQIKSKRKTIEAIRAGDITDPMSPAGELSAQYLADMDPKTVSALRERGILKKNVLAKMDSELKVLEKSQDEMYRTLKGIELGGTVSQAPTEGLTEGTPYGAGPSGTPRKRFATIGEGARITGGGTPKGPIPSQGGAGGLKQRKIVRTGTDKATGQKVVMYEDGTTEYIKGAPSAKGNNLTVKEMANVLIKHGIDTKRAEQVVEEMSKQNQAGISVDIDSFKRALQEAGIFLKWSDAELMNIYKSVWGGLSKVGESLLNIKIPGTSQFRNK